MGEVMTLDEINERFDSEWVLLEDPELTKGMEIIRGKVLFHSKDRDELYRKALELRPKHGAIFFVGDPPEEMIYALSASADRRVF